MGMGEMEGKEDEPVLRGPGSRQAGAAGKPLETSLSTFQDDLISSSSGLLCPCSCDDHCLGQAGSPSCCGVAPPTQEAQDTPPTPPTLLGPGATEEARDWNLSVRLACSCLAVPHSSRIGLGFISIRGGGGCLVWRSCSRIIPANSLSRLCGGEEGGQQETWSLFRLVSFLSPSILQWTEGLPTPLSFVDT